MIRVNEIFGPTVQGEGKNAGKPCIFIRLSMCNLHCVWCDTPHTWNWTGTKFVHPIKFDREKEEHLMDVKEVVEKVISFGSMNHIVVSGGEPLLQQTELIPLLLSLKEKGYSNEFETNGTVPLRPEFERVVDQLNVSPKLASAGDPEKLRIREKAIASLVKSGKANFKFVISSDKEEREILQFVSLVRKYGNPEIRIMPLADTREQLVENLPLAKWMAEKHNLLWTSRLSIEMSGTKRGV